MKIKIPSQTIEVDPDQWALTFGIDRSEVRADVKSYFESASRNCRPAILIRHFDFEVTFTGLDSEIELPKLCAYFVNAKDWISISNTFINHKTREKSNDN